MNPYPPDPAGATPASPGAAYFDPITGQQVYLDPTSGGFTGAPAAEPPPAYPPTYPAPAYPPAATYPASTPPASAYPASTPPAPAYPGYPPVDPAAGYPPVAYPPAPVYPPNPYGGQTYPPNPYGGQTGYPGGFYYPTATGRTNGLAVASMVVSIIGLLGAWCVGLGGIVGAAGAIMGHVSRGQLRRSNDSGGGLALAGIIVGWIALAVGILFAIVEFSAPSGP